MKNTKHWYYAMDMGTFCKDVCLPRLFIVYGYRDHHAIYGITVSGNVCNNIFIDDDDYIKYDERYLAKHTFFPTYEEACAAVFLSPVGCPKPMCEIPLQRIPPSCNNKCT